MLPEFPAPGEVTDAVAPLGTSDTLAVSDAVELVRLTVTVTDAPGTEPKFPCGNAATEELLSWKENGDTGCIG